MSQQSGDDGRRLVPMGEIQRLEMCPDVKHMGAFDPDNLTAAEILKIITIALAKASGADPLLRLKAEVVFNEQFSRGQERGRTEGFRDGYSRGYEEGMEEGRREALDQLARDEAERATVRAAASARRTA